MSLISVIILSNGHEDQLETTLSSLRFSESYEVLTLHNEEELHDLLLNGMERAQGEWLHFIEAGVSWSRGYEKILEPMLSDKSMEVFAGPLLPPRGIPQLSHALFLALSSPFCTGPYFARYRSKGSTLETSSFFQLSSKNLWVRKELFQKASVFNEKLGCSFDGVLQRLSHKGHTLFYHPKLTASYSPDATFSKLRRKLFQKGFESSQFLRERMTLGGSLHVIPPLFVICHGFWALYPEVFWPFFRLYYLLIAFISVGLSFRARRPWLCVPVFFFHYFILWELGWGFLWERLRQRWKSWQS